MKIYWIKFRIFIRALYQKRNGEEWKSAAKSLAFAIVFIWLVSLTIICDMLFDFGLSYKWKKSVNIPLGPLAGAIGFVLFFIFHMFIEKRIKPLKFSVLRREVEKMQEVPIYYPLILCVSSVIFIVVTVLCYINWVFPG